MSWRFSKVFNMGFFRIMTSKSGLGWSVGLPGLRYGRNAYGRPFVSVGFGPFRFYKYIDRPNHRKQNSDANNFAKPRNNVKSPLNRSDPDDISSNQKILKALKEGK